MLHRCDEARQPFTPGSETHFFHDISAILALPNKLSLIGAFLHALSEKGAVHDPQIPGSLKILSKLRKL